MIDYVIYSKSELLVHFNSQVLHAFRLHSQVDLRKPEACGVLVGSTSIDYKELWVDFITHPMPQDSRGRTFFFLRDKGHQKFVNSIFNKSGGTQRLLGTWHTHPEKTPSPSLVDYNGWDKIGKRNSNFTPLIFVIVGTKDIRVYTKVDDKYVELD